MPRREQSPAWWICLEEPDDDGQYFSDQTDNNILTIEVEDADLTPTRIGTARLAAPQSPATEINLVSAIVAGEKDKTERFDGGTTNGPCNEADLVAVDTNDDGVIDESTDFPAGRLLPYAADGE